MTKDLPSDDEAYLFDADDPDQSAIEWSISDGLVLSEDDRWMRVEDLIEEYGLESARRQVETSNEMNADWLRRHGLNPDEYVFPTMTPE